ncbi:MBL fold metallo-hydrolase [Bacteriovorax sp. Seq25_V]|uniref:MBL fold metallo-hydrolase n=1 Tax=Bacteriovorax sp. Seq25_V TaxID=1201288 RepID=UPI00038A27DA|nr:MBL fold metallo-hydrolase [Bacteriovorax sp. Seq25_V]EQC45991.1 beta-lactamase family protein [Bacteriovorax sp. Seq25_V]
MTTTNAKLTILGSGTSTGIPMVGCNCEVCLSKEEKNKRLRTSFYLETKNGNKVVIDTTPDLRTQALRANINHVDYCIITHDHADHLHGIDDLRPFCFGPPPKSIPVYTHRDCMIQMEGRFPYIFQKDFFNEKRPVLGGGVPRLELQEIKVFEKEITIENDSYTFFLLPHGHGQTLGLYHDKLAILIDCNAIPDSVIKYLKAKKLEHLFIDCVKIGEHKTHLTLDKSLEYIKAIGPKSSYLIHMGHGLEHFQLEKLCKESGISNCQPAFDTMHIYF